MMTEWGGNVEVFLYTPDGHSIIGPDLSSRLTSLSYTTARPGGFHGLSVSIDPVPGRFWRPFAHCTVMIDGVTVWEGRVTPPRMWGRWLTGFGAAGYGFAALADAPYSSTDTTVVTSGTALHEAVIDAAPQLVYDTSSDDPAGSHALSEFDGMTVVGILEQLVSEGTADGKPLDWFVWNGRVLSLRDGTRPTVADYHVSIDDPGITREPRDDELWGRVKVRYTDAGTGVESETAWSTATGFLTKWGVDRRTVIEGGDLTAAAAQQIRDTQAGIFNTRRFATTIARGNAQSLASPTGAVVVPFHSVRSDGWVRIPEEQERLPIVGTGVDALEGSLEVTCGEIRDDFLTVWRRMRRGDRRDREKRNRVTGARERL